jgi:hypothetical protein
VKHDHGLGDQNIRRLSSYQEFLVGGDNPMTATIHEVQETLIEGLHPHPPADATKHGRTHVVVPLPPLAVELLNSMPQGLVA